MAKNSLLISLILLMFSDCFNMQAQTYREWTGSGGNWTNNANWIGGGYTYAQLEFKGGGSTTSNNDNSPSASQWRLFFQGTQSYTLTGNPVNLQDFSGQNSWILSESSVSQTINLDIGFVDAGTRPSWITTKGTGNLIFNGDLNVGGSITHLAFANTTANGRIIVNGILSGNKNIFIGRDEAFGSQPNTSIEFTGTNTYNADTFIDGGFLEVSGSGTLGVDADVFISLGTTLVVANDLTVVSIRERGFNNGGIVEIQSGASLTINGFDKGPILQNSINGSGDLITETTGTTELNLYGNNGLTGNTIIREGTVKLSGNMSNSDISIEQGGTLIIEGAAEVTVKSVSIGIGGTLQINGGQSLRITDDLVNNGTVNLSLSSGGDLKVGGNFTQNGTLNNNNRAVFFDGAGTQTVSGSSPITFDYLRIDKLGTELNFNEDIVVTEIVDGNGYEQTNGIVTLAAGKSLIVEGGGDFKIDAGSFTLESTSTDFSTLIVKSVTKGPTATINYNRYVNEIGSSSGTGNDLVSPPLSGQAFNDFATNNDGILAASGNIRAFAPFEKPAGSFSNFLAFDTDVIGNGKGYRAATNSGGGTLKFTGDIETGPMVSAPISNSGTTFAEWNLVGNPYPYFISSIDFLANTQNISVLDDTALAIYAYNSGTFTGGPTVGSYTIINSTSNSGLNIAPGQGFFVASNSTGGDIHFTTDMRTSTGTDDFIVGRSSVDTSYYLNLNINNGGYYSTYLYFNDQSSRGLDPGYDAATFGVNNISYPFYSHLVEDNTGRSMALQSLNVSDLEDVTIPLGVNSAAGQEISFSISETTLPPNTEVYLEDDVAQTFTLLNTNDYILTPISALSGTGRFFLRIGNNVLTNTESDLNHIQLYALANAKKIVVAGKLNQPAEALVYDLQGRLITKAAVKAGQSQQTIDLQQLGTGVYVVFLSTDSQVKTQKIILN